MTMQIKLIVVVVVVVVVVVEQLGSCIGGGILAR